MFLQMAPTKIMTFVIKKKTNPQDSECWTNLFNPFLDHDFYLILRSWKKSG